MGGENVKSEPRAYAFFGKTRRGGVGDVRLGKTIRGGVSANFAMGR